MNELLTMLDTKYKRLEYIQSTGTQWIDLGLTANQDTTIKCRVSNVNSGGQAFIGLVDSGNYIYGIGQQSSNYLYGQYYGIGGGDSSNRITSDIFGNDGVIRNFELRKNEFYIDNVLIGSKSSHTFISTNTIKLFTLNPSSSISSIKMYNAQVLDGNMNLLRNMIPVMRKSDNEIGMLDLVEGKFYGNAGTGKFTANLDTMYALIQGTPTVQDGRVSGFSKTNYLGLKNTVLSKPFEIKVKFNLSSLNIRQTIIGFEYAGIFRIAILNDNKIHFNIGTSNDNFDIGSIIGTTVFQINKNYWVKLQFTGTQYIISSSEDNVNFTEEGIVTSSNLINSGNSFNCLLGNGNRNNTYNYFISGSIDLNHSYIKIDDTKYKLQAVVGWTKVGEPTITDGVVSGFSSANYIQTTSNIPYNNKSWEYMIKFTTGSDITTAQSLVENAYIPTGGSYFGVSSYIQNGSIVFRIGTGNSQTIVASSAGNIIANTTYYLYMKYDGNFTYTFYLGTSKDNLSKILTEISNYSVGNINYPVRFGVRNYTGYPFPFTGSIDLKETYIKLNNKLWFNGLEA